VSSGLGQTRPPNFAAAADLASIADAGEAWRGPRRSVTSPRRQVLPNDRTPRLTGRRPHRADIVAKVEKSGMAKIDVKAGVRGKRRS
jgi:hypothetical protein